jgi:hypothetical protein
MRWTGATRPSRLLFISAPPRHCVSQLLSSGAMFAFRNTKTGWKFRVQFSLQTLKSPSHTTVLPYDNTFISSFFSASSANSTGLSRVPCSRWCEHVSIIRVICGSMFYGQSPGASVSRSAPATRIDEQTRRLREQTGQNYNDSTFDANGTPIVKRSVLPNLFFLCVSAPLREFTSFTWGYACVSKCESCLGIQSSVFFANFEEPQPHNSVNSQRTLRFKKKAPREPRPPGPYAQRTLPDLVLTGAILSLA